MIPAHCADPCAEKAAPKPRKSGKRRLVAGLPRTFADHRASKAKRYSAAYRDIVSAWGPLEGLARRVAGMTALAAVDVEDARAALERVERRQRMTAQTRTDVSRLRRRILALTRSFEGGLRMVQDLATQKRRPPTHVRELMATTGGRS